MAKGSHFNRNSRRSGGDRRTVIYTGKPDWRSRYLKILKNQIAATGLTGADLQEVYERLEATDTQVLRECVMESAVSQAEQRALAALSNPSDLAEQHDPTKKES